MNTDKKMRDAKFACIRLIAPEFRPKWARDSVLYNDASAALQRLFARPKDYVEARRLFHEAIDQVGRAITEEIRAELQARNEYLGPREKSEKSTKPAKKKRAKEPESYQISVGDLLDGIED